MAVSGSAGTYKPKHKKHKKKGHKVTSPLRPVGSALRPVSPGLTPGMGLAPTSGLAPSKPTPKAPVQPLDPTVENEKIIGQRNVAISDLYSNFQQANLDAQYGFGAGAGLSPYTEAAKLQENYKRDVLGTTSNLASAGQYNTGAYGATQNENARRYDMGYDAIRRAYDQASGNIAFGRLQTYANAGSGIDEAKFKSLLEALRGL